MLVRDLEEAADVANLYAPEHLQIATADDEAVLAQLEHAGEILLGQWTPFSAANYTLGVPASLPTGRYARVSSGITARAFVKTRLDRARVRSGLPQRLRERARARGARGIPRARRRRARAARQRPTPSKESTP